MTQAARTEVTPSKASLLTLIVIPVVFVVLQNSVDIPNAVLFYSVFGVILLVVIALYVMYVLRTSLVHRGNELVYTDWLGRKQVIPVSDVDSAAIVRLRAGEAGGTSDKRLLLRRASGAQTLVARITLWKEDHLKQLLGGAGIAVNTPDKPVSVKQILEAFPGAKFNWMDRHPALLSIGVVLVFALVVVIFIAAGG